MKRLPIAPIIAGLLLFLLAFGITALVRLQPWVLTVDHVPDTAALKTDARLLEAELDALPAVRARSPRVRTVDTGSARTAAPPRPPNVLVVVLDTVRADRLELYGHSRSTMPRLTAWAREARVYEKATSVAPWTLSAHASLFTGALPRIHGARGSTLTEAEVATRRALRRARHRLQESPLTDRATTLAERLSQAGYRTVGIAANRAYLQSFWNLDQGFDIWLCDDLPLAADGLPYIRGDRMAALGIQALEHLAAERTPAGEPVPFLLFLNFMDAHGPYVPREGYVHDESRLIWRYRQGKSRNRLATGILSGHRDLPAPIRDSWLAAYDAELRFLDEQVDRVLQALRPLGLAEDTVVVVLSDHGEYFGEHRLLAHSKDVYQPALHIPLVVKAPKVEPGRDATPVQIHDVPRWLLRWTGAGAFAHEPDPSDLTVAELYGSRLHDYRNRDMLARFNRVRRAFILDSRKVILGDDGSFEAYDLAIDPHEQRDRSSESWARDLRKRAEQWLEASADRSWDRPNRARQYRSSRSRRGSNVWRHDNSVTEKLRELGYVD